MRYTAFLLLGLMLIVVQGELYLLLGSVGALGFRPSLLVPLLVWLGVTDTNLSLAAGIAFLLGYLLDVVGGAPVGLYTFVSVATLSLARLTGLRVVAQGVLVRALLAGAFAALGGVMALVLLAIFGRSPWVPRAYAARLLPHAIATAVFAPLIFKLAERTQAFAAGFLEPARATSGGVRVGKDAATAARDDVDTHGGGGAP